jgi:hypothetical protein
VTPQLENGKFKRDGVRKMRLLLVDEKDSVEISAEDSVDPFVSDKVRFRLRMNTLDIGMADVEQGANGGLIIDLLMAGQWTDPTIMNECLQMKGFIRAEMRKD